MQRRWKKVTPVPPEYNGNGYLYECVRCHISTTYLGGKKEPPYECQNCRKKFLIRKGSEKMFCYEIREYGSKKLICFGTGFETEEDVQMAADESMAEIIDDYAENHPEMTDEEIESLFDVDIRED